LTVPLMEGYTAITGPNGSGKSNITDAILFVLGPRSSKAVRAGRLTDLIFDGGRSKNKASHMTVTLVFDNKDRLMPWDDDIVRLTRVVRYNDARTDYYSYFYINDRKATMTDFDNLLTKARISADGYNLVQQGDVTRIVSMGVLDRRRIIDGISGIASYDADIDRAAGEKEEAETNLDRINIVMGELELQLKQLEKDREDAKKYLEAQKGLEMSKVQLLHRHLQINRSNLESYNNQIQKLRTEIQELRERKESVILRYEENESAIKAKEAEITEKVGPAYAELKRDIEEAKIGRATCMDRISSAEEDNDGQRLHIEQLEERIKENENTITDTNTLLSEVTIHLDKAEEELTSLKNEEKGINDRLSESGGEHADLQETLNGLEEKIENKNNEVNEASVKATTSKTRAEDGAVALAGLEEEIKSISFEIGDAKWSLGQAEEEAGPSVQEYSDRILKAKGREQELEKQERELNEAIRRLETRYGELSAEKKASERYNQGDAAISAIMALRDRRAMDGIHGTVQELASVDPEYETAVSVAAGGKMRAVVVENDQVAAEAIGFLKKNNLGRVTFLPLTKMMGGRPRAKAIMAADSSEGYAIDLLRFDPMYQNVFWYVMGDTLVMKNLDTARSLMGGVRMVTKQGELIEASGAMVGGTIKQNALLKFGSASESELEEVGTKLGEANDAMAKLRQTLEEIRSEIRKLDNLMREAATQGVEQQSAVGVLKARIAELQKNKAAKDEELREKKKECDARDAEAKEAEERKTELLNELEKLREDREEARARLKEIAPSDLYAVLQKIRNRQSELNVQVTKCSSEKSTYTAEIKGLANQTESYREQISATEKKISENDRRIKEHEELKSEAEVKLGALRSMEEEMESGISELRDEKDALVEKRYSLEGEKNTIQNDMELKGGLESSANASVISLNGEIEALEKEISESRMEVEMPIPSEEEIKRAIRSYEGIMSRIGNVNLRAIEDYEEIKERYDELTEEVGTLEESIKELDELTETLNGQKKGLFMESYEAIGDNFRRIYAQLSGGGEAFIDLEDEENPFNGGLLINAKPKNGKLLRLEALSGGEKSLTALAFIFAIQEHQPSPFYVLDEVDMFLDAVNAEMVAKRIVESSAKAQFIQVSLRKVTLALADHLIGVTRPPSGISKVIMQPDFAEVSKLEEEVLKIQDAAEG
jgi:chromosome segregation protein